MLRRWCARTSITEVRSSMEGYLRYYYDYDCTVSNKLGLACKSWIGLNCNQIRPTRQLSTTKITIQLSTPFNQQRSGADWTLRGDAFARYPRSTVVAALQSFWDAALAKPSGTSTPDYSSGRKHSSCCGEDCSQGQRVRLILRGKIDWAH